MALSFQKKKAPGGSPATKTPAQKTAAPKTSPKTTATTAAPAKTGSGFKQGAGKQGAAKKSNVSFMRRGKEAAEAAKHEEARIEAAKAASGKMFRFWLPEEDERQITFLDGELDEDGVLDVVAFYEHTVRHNGQIANYVCTADADPTQPCPICESGEKASLVHVFTIIDHTPYTIKTGPNAGKTVANTRKLFVAKRTVMQLLTKAASKRDGLAGCTFDVTRIGNQSSGVGSQFDFVQKHESYEQIAETYDLSMEDVQPADYEEEITYLPPEDLIEIGVGKAHVGVGTGKPGGTGNLKNQL